VFDNRLGERVTEDILSKCSQCGSPCDTHINCRNDICDQLFIQCVNCASKFDHSCSEKCKNIIQSKDYQELKKKGAALNHHERMNVIPKVLKN